MYTCAALTSRFRKKNVSLIICEYRYNIRRNITIYISLLIFRTLQFTEFKLPQVCSNTSSNLNLELPIHSHTNRRIPPPPPLLSLLLHLLHSFFSIHCTGNPHSSPLSHTMTLSSRAQKPKESARFS